MKKIFIIILIIGILIIGYNFGKDESIMKVNNNDRNVNEKILLKYETKEINSKDNNFIFGIPLSNVHNKNLISTTYVDNELFDMSQFDYNIEEYNDKYPIECLRKAAFGGYRVVYSSKDKYLILIFDEAGNKTFSRVYNKSADLNFIKNITNNSTIEDVINLDEKADYVVLGVSNIDSHYTHHYTEDGYHVYIEYDINFNVKNVNVELLQGSLIENYYAFTTIENWVFYQLPKE